MLPSPAPLAVRPEAGLVVELCGLPGAGKTTLARELVDRLQGAGHRAVVVDLPVSAAVPRTVRLARKAALVAGGLAQAPVQALREARLVGEGQPERRDRVAVPVQWLLARRLTGLAHRGSGIRVLEEGLVQAWWTAALHTGTCLDGSLLALLAGRGPRADLVVHLDVPLDLALDRLRRRASRHSRVQRQDPAAQWESLQRGDVVLRQLLGAWSGAGLGDVLLLDGAAPRVTDALLAQLPGFVRR